jgi:hypothetical protein
LIKRGEDPDQVSAERIQKHMADIEAGNVSSGHRFQKRDPLEKMIRSIVNERVRAAIATMPQKPSKQQIENMKWRLLILPTHATGIRAEAIGRLETAQKFASSPDLDRLMGEAEDDSKDSRNATREAA